MYLMIIMLACSNIDGDAWLSDQLFIDNRRWLSRDPDLVAQKLAVMGEDPYDFMRGSLTLTLADLRRYAEPEDSAFINSIDASVTLLVGDPHPENMATCVSKNGDLYADFVDLDAVTHGPWIMDLRRAATGYQAWTTAIDCGCEFDAISAMTTSYVAALNSDSPPSYRSELIMDLIEEAKEEGAERKRFFKYTREETNHRMTAKTEPLTGEEAHLLRELMKQYAEENGEFRFLDGGRLYGKGVSSLPAIRFLALIDQGEEGNEDDRLFQLREVIDPPILLNQNQSLGAFGSNADRIDKATNILWENGRGLWDHQGLSVDEQQFKIFQYTSNCQDPDHDDLSVDWNMGRTDRDEVIAFASDMGLILGQTHSRAINANGQNQKDVILADIESGGGERVLIDEMINRSTADFEKIKQWQTQLSTKLNENGPLMGWLELGDATW